MPCKTCGQKSQSSIEREREREAKAKERRAQAESAKTQYAERRQKLVAQVRADREAARGR